MISSLVFVFSCHDSTLFIKCTNTGHIIMSLYIDYMIITSDDNDGISVLKKELAKQFEMRDFGYLRYFLGIKVAYSPKGYLLSQLKYVADILEWARLTDNKTINTLIEVDAKYSSSDGLPLTYPTLYCTIIGSLVYLTITCPNIAYVIYVINQFIASPSIVY